MSRFAVESTALHVRDADLRMPFSFGTVTISQQPHLFASVDVAVDGTTERGVASDGLSPLWFRKETPFGEGLEAMLEVIRAACEHAESVAPADSVFDCWHAIYERQRRWATDTAHPPLLWGYGVSLVERAVIDAVCRARDVTFAEAIRHGMFGTRLGVFDDDLEGRSPAEFLPDDPARSIAVRHTVGLDDPLTGADVETPVDDGLPETLVESIRAGGVDHFKVKVCGDAERDAQRLTRIAAVLDREVDGGYAVTLDANESFPDVAAFRAFWERVVATPALDRFRANVLFVEQPLPRDLALDAETTGTLEEWTDRPPVIIDESDDRVGRLVEALERGYDGTSHKNVKGVFKGLAGACSVAHRNRTAGGGYVMSAEDAANVGPVALHQDLAVVGTLGVDHAERNGHHYFRGLSVFPDALQADVLDAHSDLYREHPDGYPVLDVRDGAIEIGSTVDAPFGYAGAIDIDPEQFPTLEEWSFSADG